jgi:hypothetical protein
MTEFIELFDTARDYNLHFFMTHTLVPTVTSSLPLLGSGFQRRTFLPLGSRAVPVPQLPASNSNDSQLNRGSTQLNCPPYNISARTA